MSHHSYLVHRAIKRLKANSVELRLIDKDLAEAGVQIHWTSRVRADAKTRILVLRVVQDVLSAA